MRAITRRLSGPPDFFDSDEFRNARREFRQWHESGGTRSKAGRSPLRRLLQPFERELAETLYEDFGELCAYTEVSGTLARPWLKQSVDGWLLQPTRHRPPANATSLDGSVDGAHYWWLAFEWDNFRLATEQVQSSKGASFPVSGERGTGRTPESIAPTSTVDDGLLLDPCRDQPARWLRFDEDGSVIARTSAQSDRGAITISLLDLDNAELQASRSNFIRETMRALTDLDRPEKLIGALDFLDGGAPQHGGAIAQVLIRRHLTLTRMLDGALAERLANGHAVPFIAEAAAVHHRFDPDDSVTQSSLRMLTALAFSECPEIGELDGVQELMGAPVALSAPDLSAPELSAPAMAAPPVAEPRTAAPVREVPDPEAPADSTEPLVPPTLGSPAEPVVEIPPLREIDPTVSIWSTNRIREIEIENFRAVEYVKLDLVEEDVTLAGLIELSPEDEEEFARRPARRWKVLLGENGSGKSSILHAVALTLCGAEIDQVMQRVALTWDDILRRVPEGETRNPGRVRLVFSGGEEIDLRFDVDGHRFEGLGDAAPEININVRGFGSTRFPASDRRGLSEEELLGRVRLPGVGTTRNIDNLLDTTVPILSAKAWLEKLSDGAFNVAAETLGDMLGDTSTRGGPADGDADQLSLGQRIVRSEDDPSDIRVDGDPLSLVSDGYRSVISLGCEIMASVGGMRADNLAGDMADAEVQGFEIEASVSDFRDATGIVLIDEIGAHLHPRWRMQITGKLRTAFPSVQFFITTHEPLCLRGLDEHEVTRVVKFREHGVVLDEIDRAPGRYRVDQLLTSEFFGLDSAIDPRVDRLFSEYYDLKRVKSPSSVELARLDELEAIINDKALRPVLGYTRRDQVIYEAIDKYLLNDPIDVEDPSGRQARREEIVAKVAGIWQEFSE